MAPDGFLNLLKPPGMTSHDVVALVRARLGLRRVGHLGTLDPAAAGVLPISLGRATRLFRFAGGPDKAYRAEVVFGATTDTLDADGRLTAEADSSALTAPALNALLARFLGDIEQTPPAFSAARSGGRRLHELARRGRPVPARPKRVTITSLTLIEFTPGPRARALLDVTCSAGTYIRALAADLGRAPGCGAHLGFLVRTRVGPFDLSDAATLEEFSAACQGADPSSLILPPDWPLAGFPETALDAARARGFVEGKSVHTDLQRGWPVRVYGPGARFLGLGEVPCERQLRPRVVLASEGDDPCAS